MGQSSSFKKAFIQNLARLMLVFAFALQALSPAFAESVSKRPPQVSLALFNSLPADVKAQINEKIARLIFERYRLVKNSRRFEELFLSQLSPKDEKEVKAAFFPIKQLPRLTIKKDLLTLRVGKLTTTLRFINPFDQTVEINGKLWSYADRLSALKNIQNLQDRLAHGPPQGALYRLFMPEADAFSFIPVGGPPSWVVWTAAVLGPMIVTGVYNGITSLTGDVSCSLIKEKTNIDTRRWGGFCGDWYKRQDEIARKTLGNFDSFMDLDENKELRKKYETEPLKCPHVEPGKAFTFKTKVRKSAQNTDLIPTAPIPVNSAVEEVANPGDEDDTHVAPAAPATPAVLQSVNDARPWSNVAIKVRENGSPSDLILTVDGTDPAGPTDSVEPNLLAQIKYKPDGSLEKVILRNSLYKPDDGSARTLPYEASEVVSLITENRVNTEADANLASRLKNALEIATYLKERAKECRRQVPGAPPATAIPAAGETFDKNSTVRQGTR